MLSAWSLRWAISLLLVLVLIGEITEGKRGGGSRSSSSRGSSSSRSSSKSSGSKSSSFFGGSRSSSHSSGKSWFGGSKSGGSSGKSWWSSSKSSPSSSRTGGGFKSSGSSGWGWSNTKPRPSVTSDAVSRGFFSPSRSYYGPYYGSGCGFGGCNTYTVYHYYPRSHYYYSHRTTTTTPGPFGPKADQVSNALNTNDTLLYNENNSTIVGGANGAEPGNSTEVMEIAEPAKPMLIQDLAFFWDAKYMPHKHTTGCVSLTPANSNSSISYCDVQEYTRCQRDLKELPVYRPETIFFPDGTNPSHLAWLCPKGTGCCDWECCHENSGWGVPETILLVIFIFVVVYYGGKCCMACCASIEEMIDERKYESERVKLNRQSSTETA